NGSADPLHCQGTPEGAEFPAPGRSEQSPPGLSPTKETRLEPAGSEVTVTPATSPESTLGAVSWMLPLVWLEKTLNSSLLVESLRHSLPLCKPQQDASSSVTPVPTVVTGTSVTPVPTVVAGTGTTPVPTMVTGTSVTPVPTVVAGTGTTPVPTMRSMNTSRGSVPCAKDSAAETDSLLWHCPREQLKTLPRAELEGRLESTLIIIEALALQLRDLQQSQRLRPGVGLARQRDALTQTETTHPAGSFREFLDFTFENLEKERRALDEEVRGVPWGLSPSLPCQCSVLWVPCPVPGHTAGQCHGSATLSSAWCCLPSQRGQMRALVFQSHALLERVPGKLRSCLEELAATRERAEE
ncbi:SPAG5 protein, partial [Phainopepla nitens]|nr:SPAG5 protein [Phainopepla nitens]